MELKDLLNKYGVDPPEGADRPQETPTAQPAQRAPSAPTARQPVRQPAAAQQTATRRLAASRPSGTGTASSGRIPGTFGSSAQSSSGSSSGGSREPSPVRKPQSSGGGFSGVFGGGTAPASSTGSSSGSRIRIPRDRFGRFPWIDVIFITMIAIEVILFAVNFEAVTDAIFQTLLPIIGVIFVLLIIAVVILLIYQMFFRRRRRF